jgi:phage baseplate assembly protein W
MANGDEPIYQGLAFPFGPGPTSFPEIAQDDKLVRDALIQLILTGLGERVMRPELGSDAFSFVHEDNDTLLTSAIRTTVGNAIARNESRVILQNIDIQRHRNEGEGSYLDTVIITVFYVVKATQQQGKVSVALGTNQGPMI